MNSLPVVSRELRVAARKRSTFWLRVAAATTGLVIGIGFLLLSHVRGASMTQMGGVLFNVLTWMCLAAGLSAGLFLTSDCLSEEKREGTLGLLFLTELKGYDVVLGKLLATSLRAFYALLAILPILALTELMGGVTGAQFWKSALALVDGLFVSLAAGLMVSALSRDSQKALAGTVLVLLLLALGGPVADGSIAGVKQRAFQPVWSLSSPGYVLVTASAWGRSPYWMSLATTHLLGWGMLLAACVVVPRAWQEKRRAGASSTASLAYAWKYGGAGRRRRLGRILLERQPMTWLVCRERWQSVLLWVMALGLSAAFVAMAASLEKEAWIFWSYLGGLFILLVYVWAASQACRFLVEARRSGLLELLLVTPLENGRIIQGQWRAMLRLFGLPVALLLGAYAGGATLSQLGFQRLAAQASAISTSTGTNSSAGSGTYAIAINNRGASVITGTNTVVSSSAIATQTRPRVMLAVGATAFAAISTAGNLLALCWFGMWMGLTSRSANLATLKTILFVQVIPWLVISFGSSMIIGLAVGFLFVKAGAKASSPSTWLVWWPLLSAALSATLSVVKDIGFIIWARSKLRRSFREQAAGSLGESRPVAPPPLPQFAKPPGIAATLP